MPGMQVKMGSNGTSYLLLFYLPSPPSSLSGSKRWCWMIFLTLKVCSRASGSRMKLSPTRANHVSSSKLLVKQCAAVSSVSALTGHMLVTKSPMAFQNGWQFQWLQLALTLQLKVMLKNVLLSSEYYR